MGTDVKIKFNEEIAPLTKDEQGLLRGGFTDVEVYSNVGAGDKNSKCTNQNCSIDRNLDQCKNTNCACLCDDGGNGGGEVLPNPCTVVLPNHCL